MARNKIVLALDTGSTTGYGVFHGRKRFASGILKFKQRTIKKVKQPRAVKYEQMLDALESSLAGDGPIELVRAPDVIVYEVGGYYPNPRTAESAHGFMAMVELVAMRHGIPAVALLNWDVKTHATGSQRADKDQMLAAARRYWRGVKFATHDEADALHVGRAYLDGVKHR